ncbi:hypothetical protein GH741_16820 [Aquibacillus halophilus]|uniref:Putative Flp pilus-assembly TadG-like N-terminal domain-containing protein n=1 Tax=Aquibacillus halophilus TaxID=930132 RepID=A0A6A8DF16_9BACI|nr:Tad domain-containing protein [Aquibacillus halophilus]MRH44308.1 hypothetical protein [Aquibacillus halophilus]
MNKIKKFFQRENGNALVIMALALVVLLGFVALAVDAGRVYSQKASLQKALDSAVIGGAQVLLEGGGDPEAKAIDISTKNSFVLGDSEVVSDVNSVTASKETTVPMTFARVLGINSKKVSAVAEAEIKLLTAGIGITPIAVEKDAIPGETNLKCGSTGTYSGNCGYLDIDTTGASGLAEAIINGVEISITDDVVFADTETGQKWGPVKDAFQDLIDKDEGHNGKGYPGIPLCNSFDTFDQSEVACNRVIYIVVVDTFKDVTGKDVVEIVGFAQYWLDEVINSTKSVTGKFIKQISVENINEEVGSHEDYLLKTVKLVK